MRAAISLLVSSLVLSSLAINKEGNFTSLSSFLTTTSNSHQLLADSSKGTPHHPHADDSAPHRGSGRKGSNGIV